MSESITSTGPGGPIPSRSNHAAGSSQINSLVETSKRLKSTTSLGQVSKTQAAATSSRRAFTITETELNVIARLASIGLSKIPKKG